MNKELILSIMRLDIRPPDAQAAYMILETMIEEHRICNFFAGRP